MKPFPEHVLIRLSPVTHTDCFGTLNPKKLAFFFHLFEKRREKEVTLCVSGLGGVREGREQRSLKIKAQKRIQKSSCILFVQKRGGFGTRTSGSHCLT